MFAPAPRPLLLLGALLCVAACATTEKECTEDGDCGTGFLCTDAGTCLRAPLGGDGGSGGGGGGATDACGASDDCLPAPFDLVPDVYWDGSEAGEPVCAVPLRNCPSGECAVARECLPLQDGATRPGLMRCEADADCWSGRCLEQGGARFCLRSCAEELDCPYNDETGGATVGFGCEAIVDRGVPLQSCTPIDPAAPGRTLCRSDCDCGPAGSCAPEEGLACRFVGHVLPRLHAVPVCEPLPAEPARPSGARCHGDPASCHGGACTLTCSVAGHEKALMCFEPRCSQPCGRDADCPDRLICTGGVEVERVGHWHLYGADSPDDDGRNIAYCMVPEEGCADEIDCCPTPDGAGGCLDGWSSTPRRCALLQAGPAASPRLLTVCTEPDPTRARPGACCDAPEACDSGLCVPAREGTACAGGGVCSVPCDPDPAAGVGEGARPARDRCAEPSFGGDEYHRGSSCQPFTLELPAVDGMGGPTTRPVTLNVCR